MKLLVVGASGYVGSRLVQDLSTKGHEIVAGVYSAVGERALGQHFNGEIFVGDVQDIDYRQRLADQNCEGLLYLASLNYQKFGRDAAALLAVKVEPIWHLLELGQARGLKRSVFFSTQQVYGHFGVPAVEELQPRPESGYGLAHRLGEEVSEFFNRTTDTAACSLRLANVVGAAGCWRDEFLRFSVTDMCDQAWRTGKISLRSGRGVARDFVAMTDVVSAVEILLTAKKHELFNGAFNIGSGLTHMMDEVAALVAKLVSKQTGKHVSVEFGAETAHAPAQPNDITRLRQLGFKSTMTFEASIAETLEFLKSSGR